MCFRFSTLAFKYMKYEENIAKRCLQMADRKASQNLGNVTECYADRRKFLRSTPRPIGYCWQ